MAPRRGSPRATPAEARCGPRSRSSFGLIGLGYAARRLGLVSDATGEGLSDFVFTLSVPCLIFRT
ncbi:MAG TPA: AEC family transporter, partial [Beijerinckiaceae bacterium]|nr:AEC family transporter [Beijerinckiaceae bacterium]